MNPDSNFGSNEPALPNVPGPSPAGMGMPGMHAAQGPEPSAGMPAAVPAGPPPANSWLPPTVPVQPGSNGQQGSSGLNVAAPAVADDGDIIEKEWVEKAKHIVAQTRQDPFRQARELHRFKAEYLQKRYNKKIEAVED